MARKIVQLKDINGNTIIPNVKADVIPTDTIVPGLPFTCCYVKGSLPYTWVLDNEEIVGENATWNRIGLQKKVVRPYALTVTVPEGEKWTLEVDCHVNDLQQSAAFAYQTKTPRIDCRIIYTTDFVEILDYKFCPLAYSVSSAANWGSITIPLQVECLPGDHHFYLSALADNTSSVDVDPIFTFEDVFLTATLLTKETI